jgi:hypothetical protein
MADLEKRVAELERKVSVLSEWHHEHEANKILGHMAQRIANRLFELGSARVDLELIAKLNAALGVDIMPLSSKAPKKARKYAKAGIKKK